jgi:hypothetical protein
MGRTAKLVIGGALTVYSIIVGYSCYRLIVLIVSAYSQFLDPSFG